MLAFAAGLGHEEQARFMRRLPSHKSVVTAAHSAATPTAADLHPVGNDRQAFSLTASAPCLHGVAAPSGRARVGPGGLGAGGWGLPLRLSRERQYKATKPLLQYEAVMESCGGKERSLGLCGRSSDSEAN